jgi:ubiquinone/menaquinone biosynthesis C-methylase UbiE
MQKETKNLNDRWAQYYQATAGRSPRKLLIETLPYIEERGLVLDVGAGDLTDSIFLLQKGFSVVAMDSSPASLALSREINLPNFTFMNSGFEEFDPQSNSYDLITAQLALPFNKPETFNEVFMKLKESLKLGGVFTGNFFGINDEWNTPDSMMSFHSKGDVEHLFSDMQIIKIEEEESDKETAVGIMKHWHVFNVIAVK